MKFRLLLLLFLCGCSSIAKEYQHPRIKSNTEQLEEVISKGLIPGGGHNNPEWKDPYYKNFPRNPYYKTLRSK